MVRQSIPSMATKNPQARESLSVTHPPLLPFSLPNSSVMPSDATYQLVTSGKSVTAAMEQDPTQAVTEVAYQVFPEKARASIRSGDLRTHNEYTQEDLDRAAECGKFPYRPSDLFLKVCV